LADDLISPPLSCAAVLAAKHLALQLGQRRDEFQKRRALTAFDHLALGLRIGAGDLDVVDVDAGPATANRGGTAVTEPFDAEAGRPPERALELFVAPDRDVVLRREVADRVVDGELPLLARHASCRSELDRYLINQPVARRHQRRGDVLGREAGVSRGTAPRSSMRDLGHMDFRPTSRPRGQTDSRSHHAASSPWSLSPPIGATRKEFAPHVACPKWRLDGLRGMHMAVPSPQREGVEYALRSYLALLAGGAPSSHFLEIRYRVREQQLASEFHPVHEPEAVMAAIRGRGSRTDVYVGCAPRVRRSGTKDAVSQVWTLWAECDGEEAASKLQRFRPQPALVVASGSGRNCHAYWPLLVPLSPRRAELANLRLVQALGADPNCFDASRILRPPGSWNHKHQPPHPVGVLRLHAELRFTADEVVAHRPQVGSEIVERRWDVATRPVRDDPLLSIPPRAYVADLLGRRPGRDGKVACPFHNDTKASLHAYPTGARGWYCFSCRRGGTIYDLAAAVWALEPRGRGFIELRQRLLERYGRELAAGTSIAR
jgi:hypothetical protein